MPGRGVRVVAVIVSAAMAGGCATVMHGGTTQTIVVTSEPTGATATVDGKAQFVTPTRVKLKRGEDHVIVFAKDGFQETQAFITRRVSLWIIGNIVLGLLGAVGGITVDMISGSGWTLKPGKVKATLVPVGEALPAAMPQAQVEAPADVPAPAVAPDATAKPATPHVEPVPTMVP